MLEYGYRLSSLRWGGGFFLVGGSMFNPVSPKLDVVNVEE